MAARASRRSAAVPVAPLAFMLHDDGVVPNNPRLPLIYYHGAIDLSARPDPARVIESLFAMNGWGDMWRNGIFPYLHYHSQIHESLGIARGGAKVRFGGEQGQTLDVTQGDVVLLPAGTGHQCLWASPDLMVIGAYPSDGCYDLCRGSQAEHAKALQSIPKVPLPESDPVYGERGPLLELWRK
jgi:uncharacterized protein YjlB